MESVCDDFKSIGRESHNLRLLYTTDCSLDRSLSRGGSTEFRLRVSYV